MNTNTSKKSILFVSPHITQNAAPFIALNKEERYSISVAYLSSEESSAAGEEFLNKSCFDTDVLQGYPWFRPKNFAPKPGLDSFFGLMHFSLLTEVRKSSVVVVYGHAYFSCWLSILAALALRKPLLLTNDRVELAAKQLTLSAKFKHYLRKLLYGSLCQAVLVPSTKAKRFLVEALGVPERKVFLTPYVVDNDQITAAAARVNRQAKRRDLGVAETTTVFMFCAKLIARKRPQDALEAFAKLGVNDSVLIVIGNGPLYSSLIQRAATLKLSERVRFLGFVPYSQLPEFYCAADVLVHPAEDEPFGLILNEALLCGLPVIASNRVGGAEDLLPAGAVYPAGDILKLTELMADCVKNRAGLKLRGEAGKLRMQSWGTRENVDGLYAACSMVLGESETES